MRFLGRTTPSAVGADTSVDTASPDAQRSAGKGRPTPKRRDAQRGRRGPVPPPPRTQREALRWAKANRPDKAERRRRNSERRQLMEAGDDRYLPAREKGPVKAYIRDVVDSRRHIIGLFMPLAGLVFVSILVQNQQVQTIISITAMAIMGSMIVEGIFLGRQIATMARAKFPDEEIKGFGTGWYAFTRASQPRKLRVPRPRVARGATL